MKRKIQMYSLKALLVSALCIATFSVRAGSGGDQDMVEQTKTIIKSFPAHATTSVEVVNKYGSVRVNTWKKDSVRIEIRIVAKARRIQDADNLIASTEFNLGGSTSFITAQTLMGRSTPRLKQGWNEVKKGLGMQKTTVDYTIYMPATNKLSISNKFGDVYLPIFEGDLRVNVSHGDFRAKAIKSGKKIELKYGTIDIEHFMEGNIHIASGDLIMDEIEEANIYSSSSELHLEKVIDVRLESKYDKVFIEEVEKLGGESKFSHFKVTKLTGKLDMTTRYGSYTIKKVEEGFRRINLTGEFTDYNLAFDEMTKSGFDVQLDFGNDFTYPLNGIEVIQDPAVFENNSKHYTGYLGSESEAAFVRIRTKGSYVKFAFY
jgi:hypothetical protein